MIEINSLLLVLTFSDYLFDYEYKIVANLFVLRMLIERVELIDDFFGLNFIMNNDIDQEMIVLIDRNKYNIAIFNFFTSQSIIVLIHEMAAIRCDRCYQI